MVGSLPSGAQNMRAAMRVGLIESFGRIGAHWFIFFLLTVFPFLAIWGAVAVSYGLPLHFRDDLTILNLAADGQFFRAIVNSPSFFTHAFTAFFAGLFWLLAAAMANRDAGIFAALSAPAEVRYLTIRISATSLFMLYAAMFPISDVVPSVGSKFGLIEGESGPGEILRCLLGIALGIAVFAAFAALSRAIATRLGLPRAHVLLALLVALIASLHFFPKLLTVVALFKILAGVAAFYVLINLFSVKWQFWAFLAFVALPLFIGSLGNYKYSFPGMERLYGCPLKLEQDRLAGPAERPLGKDCQDRDIGNPPARLAPAEALARFARYEEAQNRTLKGRHLVVVATSGGGYRATFWTALVLDRLRRMSGNGEANGMARYVRLLTGASGGMIGAAYFASLSPDELVNPDRKLSLVELVSSDISTRSGQQSGGFLVELNEPLPRDSLSDVAQQLAFWDSLHIFIPAWIPRCVTIFGTELCRGDRGRTLEASWKRIGGDGAGPFTFDRLGQTVAGGNASSIIFSPMILETGQPLLISDLELGGIADSEEQNTWDFFAAFPAAWKTFKVQTAARMSATFPYVAPAVSLPTDPPRRVVDAGYFDNYGMVTALSYLRRPEVRKWMADNELRGALIIQINAFPALLDVKQPASYAEQAKKCEEVPPYAGFNFVEWLTGPFEALTAARERSMLFRNEQGLDALREIYASEKLGLTRIAFENTSRSSYSWFLPEQHFKCMQDDLETKENNRKAVELLGRLWRDENPDEGWDWPRRGQ